MLGRISDIGERADRTSAQRSEVFGLPLRGLAALSVPESAAETPALVGVETTPYACGLVGTEGILEAGFLHRAFGADPLGPRRGGWFLRGRKEDVAVHAVARGTLAPVNIRLPHDVCQSQQLSASLRTNPYNVHGARDNSKNIENYWTFLASRTDQSGF